MDSVRIWQSFKTNSSILCKLWEAMDDLKFSIMSLAQVWRVERR